MACAGRGRGLLQSVMTEGNKQLQLGHSGSCCGAPFPLSLSLSLLLLLYALWSRDEWRSGSIKWLQEADEANNERQQQATTALFATVARVAALLLCMTGCGLFFFGLLVWTKHRYTSANWSLSAAPAALPVAALHWSSSSGSFNTLT